MTKVDHAIHIGRIDHAVVRYRCKRFLNQALAVCYPRRSSDGRTISSAGLKAELCFPVSFFAQSQVRLEGFALLGNEAFEQGSLALHAERLDLFRGQGLLRKGLVDAEVAALAVAAATVEVLSIGLLDCALLAFRAHERSRRRSCASRCRL